MGNWRRVEEDVGDHGAQTVCGFGDVIKTAELQSTSTHRRELYRPGRWSEPKQSRSRLQSKFVQVKSRSWWQSFTRQCGSVWDVHGS